MLFRSLRRALERPALLEVVGARFSIRARNVARLERGLGDTHLVVVEQHLDHGRALLGLVLRIDGPCGGDSECGKCDERESNGLHDCASQKDQ